MTYGSRGESGNYWVQNPNGTEEECGAIRHQESMAAADYLGATIEFWGYNDYPFTWTEETMRRLTRRILDIRPEIIFTHWMEDLTNLDHEITDKGIIQAVSSGVQIGAFPNTPAHYFPNIYFFETTVPLAEFNAFNPDTYISIDAVYERKKGAITRFACQPQLVEYYAHCAKHRGFQASNWAKQKITYAEAFKRYLPYVGTTLPLTERFE
jgi:4-oxalomesaconate hydratase